MLSLHPPETMHGSLEQIPATGAGIDYRVRQDPGNGRLAAAPVSSSA